MSTLQDNWLNFTLISEQQCPSSFPQPKFRLGDRVFWSEVPNPDFGLILGMFYSQEASCQITGLHYLILLDKDSPSYSICTHDFAFEDDIELVSVGNWYE